MTSSTANTRRNLMDHAGTENDRSHLISQFWQQWQESRDQLYRCCLKMMNSNRMDAEDALSQAMVKAWEKVQKFGEKITNLKAWLYQVTRNFCIDLIRKGSCGAVGVESIEWVGNNEEVITTGTVECPESVLEREERSQRIRGAIAELPNKCRETFILHFYRELSYKEIAEQQGISYDNVCKRISLARKQLKEKLSAYFGDSESEVGANSNSSLHMSGSSQSPTPEENGEKQQQIRSQDDKSVLETETVSVESEIAKVQPFPNNNPIFSCHDLTPSGDRPISPSQPEVEKLGSIDSLGELDRVRKMSDEKTELRYTEEISLPSTFSAPLLISIQRWKTLMIFVRLTTTYVVNLSRDPLISVTTLNGFFAEFEAGSGKHTKRSGLRKANLRSVIIRVPQMFRFVQVSCLYFWNITCSSTVDPSPASFPGTFLTRERDVLLQLRVSTTQLPGATPQYLSVLRNRGQPWMAVTTSYTTRRVEGGRRTPNGLTPVADVSRTHSG